MSIQAPKPERELPRPHELYGPYWEYARKGELRLQRCGGCGDYIHFPKEACPQCGGSRMEWARLSGKGVVDSFVIVYHVTMPGFDEPYVVAQVSPEEQASVRIACNILECDKDDVYIGMPVEVTFEQLSPEWTIPQFRPAAGATGPNEKQRSSP